MVKADVDLRFDSAESLAALLIAWGLSVEGDQLTATRLRGGYSGTNYLLKLASPIVLPSLVSTHDDTLTAPQTSDHLVLKICHGYTPDSVEQQVAMSSFLVNEGFHHCCAPYRLAPSYFTSSSPAEASKTGSTQRYFVHTTADGEPCVLLQYLDGRGGDRLIHDGLLKRADTLSQIGSTLASLHCSGMPADQNFWGLRSYELDGVCFLSAHLADHYRQLFDSQEEEMIRCHPYVGFYKERYEKFITTVSAAAEARQSVLHGDPFIDNVLFAESTSKIVGFVDWEDSCLGPSLLDLACCIVGNCFETVTDGVSRLDIDGLGLILRAYVDTARSKFSIDDLRIEFNMLPDMLIVALMLNATWRFTNFNITHPQLRATHGDKFYELQQRIEILETPEIATKVKTTLDSIF